MSQQQKIAVFVINLFILALLIYVGFVWARPMIVAGEWFGVALIGVVIGAVWHVVKGEGV